MTKQEEIKEWLEHNFHETNTRVILDYLQSQGVVIKVAGELSVCECCNGAGLIGGAEINDCCLECNGTGKMFCVGYVAVEPLV